MSAAQLARKVVRNALSQMVGRNLIALARLAVAATIVRLWGRDAFGEYSLILGLLTMAEWVLDFGTTEIFVRDICRDRAQEPTLLGALAAAKLVQAPAAFAFLAFALWALRYPKHILEAGLVGGFSLVFLAAVLVLRALVKADLALHLEVFAELMSVLAMVGLVWVAGYAGAGLLGLFLCHTASRAVFFTILACLVRSRYRASLRDVHWTRIAPALRSSLAVGMIGLLVVFYESVDIIVLSKFSSTSDLAYYSAAQRLIWPLVMALSSVGSTLYPLAASFWPHDRSSFEHASQRALNLVLLLAVAAACCTMASAESLMALLGKNLQPGSAALRILALLLVVKAVTATLGPVLYVVHAQRQALQFIILAVLAKVSLAAAVAPRYGYLGVALASLLTEAFFAALPSVAILQSHSGYQIRWKVPLRLATAGLATVATITWAIPDGTLAAGIAAGLFYLPLALMSGAVRKADLTLWTAGRTA